MSRIIQPFGRTVIRIELKFDDKGQMSCVSERTIATGKGFAVVPLAVIDICRILAQAIAGTLTNAATGGLQELKKEGKTDGTTGDPPND